VLACMRICYEGILAGSKANTQCLCTGNACCGTPSTNSHGRVRGEFVSSPLDLMQRHGLCVTDLRHNTVCLDLEGQLMQLLQELCCN